MTRVAILTPSLTTADAVSNDVLGEFDALTRNGHEVRLFCESHSLKHSAVSGVASLNAFLKARLTFSSIITPEVGPPAWSSSRSCVARA